MDELKTMENEQLVQLLEALVRKWHYEPCEEVILPFSYEEVRAELLRRLEAPPHDWVFGD